MFAIQVPKYELYVFLFIKSNLKVLNTDFLILFQHEIDVGGIVLRYLEKCLATFLFNNILYVINTQQNKFTFQSLSDLVR